MLNPGDAMLDLSYVDAEGRPRRLSEAWSAGPAWLLWMRHCGCAFFAEAMSDLARTRAAGTIPRACILQADAAEAARRCRDAPGCTLCVPDPALVTFEAIGLGHATMAEILLPGPELKARRKQAAASGAKQDWKRTFARGNDVRQLPGAALVDGSGIIRFVHRGKHTGDHLTASHLQTIAAELLAP